LELAIPPCTEPAGNTDLLNFTGSGFAAANAGPAHNKNNAHPVDKIKLLLNMI
jgi:hypothetical protein